jgi:hypothetical protein
VEDGCELFGHSVIANQQGELVVFEKHRRPEA